MGRRSRRARGGRGCLSAPGGQPRSRPRGTARRRAREREADAGGHEREVRDEGERVLETGADRRREAGRPGRSGGAALTCRTRGPSLTGGTGRHPPGHAHPSDPPDPQALAHPPDPRALAHRRDRRSPAGPRSPATPGSPGGPAHRARPACPGSPAGPRSPRAPRGPRSPAAGPGLAGPGSPVAARARVVPVRRVPVVLPRAVRRAAPLLAASPDGVPPFVSGSTRAGCPGGGPSLVLLGCAVLPGQHQYLQCGRAEPTPAATRGSRGGSQTTRPRRRRSRVSPGHPEGYCCACRFSGCTAHTNRSIPARSSPPSSRRRRRGSTRRCRRTTSRRGAAVRGTRRSPGRGWARRCRPRRCRSAS